MQAPLAALAARSGSSQRVHYQQPAASALPIFQGLRPDRMALHFATIRA